MGSKVTVIRHPRENLKKCSLRHLHGRADFEFFKATENFLFDATGFILLEIGAPPIMPSDGGKPILLLDSTWRLLPSIRAKVRGDFVPRSIPQSVRTAYPRVSKVFSDPDGLATIEALYAALKFSGSPDPTVLKGYPFAKKFIEINGWLADIPSADFFDESESVFCD